MELRDILNQMMDQNRQASQPAELKVGTVTATAPLAISINPSMAPIQSGLLYLTAAVVERKLSPLSHTHTLSQGSTGTGLENVVCTENGTALPADSTGITLNRGLEVGDKVLLLRVQRGQKYIVLSRVFEGG